MSQQHIGYAACSPPAVKGLAKHVKNIAKYTALGIFLCCGSSLYAENASEEVAPTRLILNYPHANLERVEITKSYALGIVRFDLDHQTELMGWQVANEWYLGRQDGLDSGLTLVWQQAANQVSFSRDGVRLTRRF